MEEKLLVNIDYCAHKDKSIEGKFETVRARGRIVIENGKYPVEKGNGQFIKSRVCVNL